MTEVGAILQVLIDQVSKQQTTMDQIITRITALEESTKKQQMLINHIIAHKLCSSRKRKMKRCQSGKFKAIQTINEQALTLATSVLGESKHKSLGKAKLNLGPKGVSSKSISRNSRKKTSKKSTSSRHPQPLTSPPAPIMPIAKPIEPNKREISSSEINIKKLISIDRVVSKYHSFVEEGKIISLASRIAIEAVIGKDVMVKCTPKGLAHRPGLPTDSLYTIKQALLKTFPSYWSKPEEFEEMWLKCIKGLERACSGLRKSEYKKRITKLSDSTHSHESGLVPPAVRPIIKIINPLPSSDIIKSNLISFEEFKSHYVDGQNHDMLYICQKLALEVVFGRDVLERCSPYGRGSYPGLPAVELNQLKQMVLDCFPSLWNDSDEFEERWLICIQGLSKYCSTFRRALEKHSLMPKGVR